jgi:hypothetical protein
MEELKKRFETIKNSAEGNFFNMEAAVKRKEDAKGTNPCFTGDMRLLTVDGYKTFEELNDSEVNIFNKDGDISNSKVWCSGEKEVIELVLNTGSVIRCTPNHIFMLDNGTECVAENLLGKQIVSYNKIATKPKVMKINKIDMEKVYDFCEPLTNWGVVEGFIVHNCGEIILTSKQFCNLTTINLMAFVVNGILDKEELFKAQRLSARAGYRMTLLELELPEWNKNQKKDRLIGCSITGYQDMVNATSMSLDDQKQLLRELKNVAIKSADEYASSLGLSLSELKTTIKPEGTLSLLPTVSAGVHYSHSTYYIRRIRINSSDPLVKVCEELGYPIFPENGQEWETCKTKVIEFPIASPLGRTKYDVSAIEQLENYKMFMENYVEHNASNTISVRSHEWEEVIQWVYDNWDSIIGVTFISLDDSFYQLLPYESITKEEYEARKQAMKPFIPSLISKYEIEEVELDIGSAECAGGACPLR